MALIPLDFSAFHRLHREVYVRWSERYLGNRADAEEAVDEAIEKLHDSWGTVLATDNPAGYAWQVMKHRTIDYARARGRRSTLINTLAFETTALRDAVDPIGELEDSLALARAVAALSDRQRDVIVLRYYEGYSNREIAGHLGITEAGVRSTERYARRRLRDALTEERHEQP
jgi:RNA polymerase sigma-70 factor (ECF subfamily)